MRLIPQDEHGWTPYAWTIYLAFFFLYPFAYGFVLAFSPAKGGWAANYVAFFSDPYLYDTIAATLRLALPVTVVSLVLAVPIALRVRLMRRQRPSHRKTMTSFITTICLIAGSCSPREA